MMKHILSACALLMVFSAQAANYTITPQGDKLSFQFHSDTLPEGLTQKAQLVVTNLQEQSVAEAQSAHRIRFTQLNNRNARAIIEQVMEVTTEGNKKPSCRVIFGNQDLAFKTYQALLNELQVKKSTRLHCVGQANVEGTVEVELGMQAPAFAKNSFSITGL